jgi:nucleoid-associated protein YgaU
MEEKKPPSWSTPVSSPKATKPAPAPAAAPSAPSAPSAPAPADNKYSQWHEVVSGDSLWKIAKKYYGDGSLYMEIFKANQDVLSDPDKIQVGQKLRIP